MQETAARNLVSYIEFDILFQEPEAGYKQLMLFLVLPKDLVIKITGY